MSRSKKQRRARKQQRDQRKQRTKQRQPPQANPSGSATFSFEFWSDDTHDDWDSEEDWNFEDDDWDLADDEFGFYPFPAEALERFADYEEAIYFATGVMLKFYPSHVIIRAPDYLRDTKDLEAMVVWAFEQVGRKEVDSDWGYWDESTLQKRIRPEPRSELRDAAAIIRHRSAEEWVYYLIENVTVCFSGNDTFVRGPQEVIDSMEFRMLVGQSILDRRGLRDQFCQVRDTEGGTEAMKLMGNVTYQGLDGKSVWNWNASSDD